MNFAAKEFIETGIDWASAALSRLAKEHGGPKQLIADIYENGYLDGYNDALKDEKMKRFGIVGISADGTAAETKTAVYVLGEFIWDGINTKAGTPQ